MTRLVVQDDASAAERAAAIAYLIGTLTPFRLHELDATQRAQLALLLRTFTAQLEAAGLA